jgi:hypothetical protein
MAEPKLAPPERDLTDPNHAFDPITGQNLAWDPSTGSWIDVKTGVAVTKPPLRPEILAKLTPEEMDRIRDFTWRNLIDSAAEDPKRRRIESERQAGAERALGLKNLRWLNRWAPRLGVAGALLIGVLLVALYFLKLDLANPPEPTPEATTVLTLIGGNGTQYWWSLSGYVDRTIGCDDYVQASNPNVATGTGATRNRNGYVSLSNGVLRSGVGGPPSEEDGTGTIRSDGSIHLVWPQNGPEETRSVDATIGAADSSGGAELSGSMLIPYPNGSSGCLLHVVSTSGALHTTVEGFGGQ